MIYTIIKQDGSVDLELYHHGVLGQKWGIRRFQPYLHGQRGKEVGKAAKVDTRPSSERPLRSSSRSTSHKASKPVNKAYKGPKSSKGSRPKEKMSKEDKYTEKYIKAMKSGNARKLAKYSRKLSDKQLRRAADRVNLENSLMKGAQERRNLQIQKFENLTKTVKGVSEMSSSAVNIYNNIAGASNTFRGTNYKLVKTKA